MSATYNTSCRFKPSWEGETKGKTYPTLAVRVSDYISRRYHIPIVEPIDDAAGPTNESHTEGDSRRESVPADCAEQPRNNGG